MKKNPLFSNWFILLLVSIFVALLTWFGTFANIERMAYDWGVRGASNTPSSKITLIAIDERSIENLGRWPWSRQIHSQMIDKLTEADAKVVGYNIFFFEPEINAGLTLVEQLLSFIEKKGLTTTSSTELEAQRLSAGFNQIVEQLETAQNDMNSDQAFADSLSMAGNVVLPLVLVMGEPQGNPDAPLADFILKNIITDIQDHQEALLNEQLPFSAVEAGVPLKLFGNETLAIGHLNSIPDSTDGAIRTEALVIDYYNQYIPSMALILAAKSLNLKPSDITVNLGEGVQLGNLKIKTNENLEMRTAFYPRDAFPMDSFFDVMTGEVPLSKFKNKIVLIGPTATGLGDSFVTPVAVDMLPIEIMAHNLSSILNEDFFISPKWAWMVETGLFIFIALLLMFVLSRLNAAPAAIVTILLMLLLISTHYYLMTKNAIWLQLTPSIILLAIGYLVLITKRFFSTERSKIKSEEAGAESNKMLGLSLQGQGQLDAAFDKFSSLPMDGKVMELLNNLALDFERKRQFNKAYSVYQTMYAYDPKFRDLETRLKRAKQIDENVMLGGGTMGGATMSTMLNTEGDIEKPMLGRYEVQKELGKGAMGVVYLGVDPKINRTVAIKTMALSEEFEADELEEVKARFFREAETAGRLNHPNIVTIFDAGEEHDLAYIAMEFIDGYDLARYTKVGKLMPPKMALSVIAQCADALAFAHQQNIVHRDIKPANIMYSAKQKELKVTDFGIARITDSSKTKTGMVLGTPSYMSPEQLAGKKVDGRSDLFSLGVMMYQLLTGKLPFTGDSMASLMFHIANEAHQPINELNKNLPSCIMKIIDKALAKDVEQRYQTGTEFNKDIRVCLKQFN